MRIFHACLLLIALPAALPAAHQLGEITVHGAGLASPVEIVNPDWLRHFTVWSGPGAFQEGVEDAEGFIVDWQRGPVDAPPARLDRYEVRFFEGCYRGERYRRCGEPALVHVVPYAVDHQTGRGYVYLPGPGDAGFEQNRSMWHGGREGNWYFARPSWDEYVTPKLASARGR